MSIPLEARLVDLVNLVVAKGSNFILTVLLFALISRGMDSRAFGEFGYWWSVALMIGGVLLGGFSSALIRAAAQYGSLRHLGTPLGAMALGLPLLACACALVLYLLPQHAALLLLLAVVALFGVTVQIQTAVLSLLRAAEATRANAIASALIVLSIPAVLYFVLGVNFSLIWVFGWLAAAFLFGTLMAVLSARVALKHFASHPGEGIGESGTPAVGRFFANASSFTAINIFSYAVVNVDFTLFRLIGSSEDFALMATAKIFFERFVVPVLMVFAGAVSLRVLRFQSRPGEPQPRLELKVRPLMWMAVPCVVLLLTAAYWIFVHWIRHDTAAIAPGWVVCASLGYLLYAVNGILLDVLVVQRSLKVVVAHVAGFLVTGCAIQAMAISQFGVPGWAIGWLLFNLLVALLLAREGLSLHARKGL
jgi:O-antigen/teichoic acid export membrane protein